MIGITFMIPVLIVVIGAILVYKRNNKTSNFQCFAGEAMLLIGGLMSLISIAMVPIRHTENGAWIAKYDACRLVMSNLIAKGDCIERAGFAIKVAEVNGELAERQYYATCGGGIFKIYYPDTVLKLKPIKM